MNIIETIERGTDNFKVIDVPKINIKVGMVVLPRLVEIEMISRARDWCKKQDPIIDDPDLIKVQEDAFLLWKSLVHSEDPWRQDAEGKKPNQIFDSIEAMERVLTGDWQDWLGEELIKFRESVSPLSNVQAMDSIEKILESIRQENEMPERFIQAFQVIYCTRHGMLPTERRVKETTTEQWWLIWYSLPDEEKVAILKSPLVTKVKKGNG